MKIKNKFKLRQVAGEDIVIPLADKSEQSNGIFRLNEEAAGLFRIFLNGINEQDGISFLVDNYGISHEEAGSDVRDFIDLLKKYDMIEE